MVRPSTATFFSSTPLLSLSLALLQATGSTARASHIGRGCNGEHVAKLNPLMFATNTASSGDMSKRQDSSSMSSTPGYNPNEMDPTVQCTGYSYAPVLDNKAKFPTIWETAQLVPGDQVAADLYAKAVASVQALTPNVQVKGNLNGDFCESRFCHARRAQTPTDRLTLIPPSPLSLVHPDLQHQRSVLLVDLSSM